MKKILLALTLIGTTHSLMALNAEQAYLYKDPRIMGMGGANIAVGSYSTSVFSNPAGLAKIKKEHGFVVDMLGVGISLTAQIEDFANDIDAAGEDSDELSEVIKKYSGESFHMGVDNYSAISKNSDLFAWSVGILAAADANFMTHASGTENGDLIETSTRGYAGIVLGAAKPYHTEYGRIDIGVGLKYISQVSYEGTLGINDLTDEDTEDEDIGQKFRDEYEKTSSGLGLDLGVNYYPFADNYWNPVVGLSIMNIGLDMDDNYGHQPMTVNIGVSVNPKVDYVDNLILAIDYVDMFGANQLRIYDFSDDDSTGEYTDHDTYSFMKNLRLGVGVGLIDTTYFSTQVNLGLYQGAYTAGLDLALSVLKLNIATYEENVGTADTPIEDRRYMAQLGIGW